MDKDSRRTHTKDDKQSAETDRQPARQEAEHTTEEDGAAHGVSDATYKETVEHAVKDVHG